MRNSSLVEWMGADNVARLKHRTEAVDILSLAHVRDTKMGMVGERSAGGEA